MGYEAGDTTAADGLESLVERQQATIERQRERVAAVEAEPGSGADSREGVADD